jgi:hypothetical protein
VHVEAANRVAACFRALKWEQLYDPVLPGIFITWAKRTQIEFPPELEAAVAANGHVIEDWKSLYDKLCASIDERIAPWKEVATNQKHWMTFSFIAMRWWRKLMILTANARAFAESWKR